MRPNCEAVARILPEKRRETTVSSSQASWRAHARDEQAIPRTRADRSARMRTRGSPAPPRNGSTQSSLRHRDLRRGRSSTTAPPAEAALTKHLANRTVQATLSAKTSRPPRQMRQSSRNKPPVTVSPDAWCAQTRPSRRSAARSSAIRAVMLRRRPGRDRTGSSPAAARTDSAALARRRARRS